jgi:hypothetical protein
VNAKVEQGMQNAERETQNALPSTVNCQPSTKTVIGQRKKLNHLKNYTMATIVSFHPFLFKGKIGNIVGYVKNGKQIACSLPKKSRVPRSAAQKLQQNKFKLIIQFFQPLKLLLNETLKNTGGNKTTFNLAHSYNIRNAVLNNSTRLKIDYPRVMLVKGLLPMANKIAASASGAGELKFEWTRHTKNNIVYNPDSVWVAAYCEELKKWKYDPCIAQRKNRKCVLDVKEFSGKRVHTYIGFYSADRKQFSDSQYCGVVNIF